MIWTPLAMMGTFAGAGVAVLVWLRRRPSDFVDPMAARGLAGMAIAVGVAFSAPLFFLRVSGPKAAMDPIGALTVVGAAGLGIATFSYFRSSRTDLPEPVRSAARSVAIGAGIVGAVAFVGSLIAVFTLLPG
jgi:hypothetical protein